MTEFFNDNDLKWYTEQIIVLINKEGCESKKAYENENKLKELFNTFD